MGSFPLLQSLLVHELRSQQKLSMLFPKCLSLCLKLASSWIITQSAFILTMPLGLMMLVHFIILLVISVARPLMKINWPWWQSSRNSRSFALQPDACPFNSPSCHSPTEIPTFPILINHFPFGNTSHILEKTRWVLLLLQTVTGFEEGTTFLFCASASLP